MCIVDDFQILVIQANHDAKEEQRPLNQWRRSKGGFMASMFIFGKQKKKKKTLTLCYVISQQDIC